MKELALSQIENVDLKIKTVPVSEREDKLNLLYSLCYVWDPYRKVFVNWSIDKSLKATIIYSSDLNGIIKLHHQFVQEFIEKNGQIRTFEEVEKSIYKKDKITNLELYFELLCGIFGLIMFLTSIVVFFLTRSYSVTLVIAMCSMLLVYYWVTQKQIHSEYESEFGEAPIWIKYKGVFILFKYMLMAFIYYLIHMITDSYWIPAFIVAFSITIVKTLIQKRLSRKYWQYTGINDVRNYYEE